MNPGLTRFDSLLVSVDHGLKTIFGKPAAARPIPSAQAGQQLTPDQQRLSAALMRVNHVGEVCAQALYQSQALMTHSPELRGHFEQAAQEELDHLAWTRERLQELGGRTSLLTPIWYGGAFTIGCLAGLAGDRISLGLNSIWPATCNACPKKTWRHAPSSRRCNSKKPVMPRRQRPPAQRNCRRQ